MKPFVELFKIATTIECESNNNALKNRALEEIGESNQVMLKEILRIEDRILQSKLPFEDPAILLTWNNEDIEDFVILANARNGLPNTTL